MQTNQGVIESFIRGEPASGLHIESRASGQGYQLIGYGWAVYADKSPSGIITIHEGWRGYSHTTSRHLGMLRRAARCAEDKAQPKL